MLATITNIHIGVIYCTLISVYGCSAVRCVVCGGQAQDIGKQDRNRVKLYQLIAELWVQVADAVVGELQGCKCDDIGILD